MVQNVFDPSFGTVPEVFLDYQERAQQIVNWLREAPSPQVGFITGIRGSGKTVLMNYVGQQLASQAHWSTIRINNNAHLFQGLYAQLVDRWSTWHLDQVKVGALTFAADQLHDEVDYALAVERLLRCLQQLQPDRRVLLLLDEAGRTPAMREFAQTFALWKSDRLPVHVLMTGLLEEITALSSDQNLTFLLRADHF